MTRCRRGLWCLFTAMFISLYSCATLKTDDPVGVSRNILPPDSDVIGGARTIIAETSSDAASITQLLIASASIPEDAAQTLAERIDSIIAGVSVDQDVRATGVALGSFPVGAIRLKLNQDDQWIRVKSHLPYHVQPSTGLQICVVSRQMVLFSNGSMEHALDRMSSVGHQNYGAGLPDELWAVLFANEAYIYSSNPGQVLKRLIPIQTDDYPLLEVVALFNSADSGIGVEGWLLLESERQAKTFAVMVRILLLSEARKTGDAEVAELIKTSKIMPEGNRVTFEGVALSTEQIERLLTILTHRGEEQ